jgi:hypothetical protein
VDQMVNVHLCALSTLNAKVVFNIRHVVGVRSIQTNSVVWELVLRAHLKVKSLINIFIEFE